MSKAFIKYIISILPPSSIIFVHSSMTFIGWNAVDLPPINPYCLSLNSEFLYIWSIIWSIMRDSRTLHAMYVRLTGLLLFAIFRLLFLYMAVIVAVFQACGSRPHLSDVLNIISSP